MLEKIVKFNDCGMEIPISIGYQRSEFEYVSKQEALDYINCYSKESFSWEYNNKKIVLSDTKYSIRAYPTVDMQYMVAIYQGKDGAFSPPRNAVVYNLDGSVHKVLEVPKLISERLKKEIEKQQHSNPPIEAIKYENGLGFYGFGWDKNKEGKLFNYISIQYLRDYGEGRELDLVTGEIGRLIDDWYNYY